MKFLLAHSLKKSRDIINLKRYRKVFNYGLLF